jgi:hypothetical protein
MRNYVGSTRRTDNNLTQKEHQNARVVVFTTLSNVILSPESTMQKKENLLQLRRNMSFQYAQNAQLRQDSIANATQLPPSARSALESIA